MTVNMQIETAACVPKTTRINTLGHLEIGGCDTVELAAIYGTPLYVMDESTIRWFCQQYTQSFSSAYPSFSPLYASKALMTIEIAKIIASEGFGFDVISVGELLTVLAAGVAPQRIYFHGNNKSKEELDLALQHHVGRIVVDNEWELGQLEQLAVQHNRIQKILLRLSPEIDAHTHDYIKTGTIDSKFGFNKQDIVDIAKRIQQMSHLKLVGLHSHIGSQIFDGEPFVDAAEILINHINEIYLATNLLLTELNIGGGLGIAYTHTDDPHSITDYAPMIIQRIKELTTKLKLPLPKLIIEPGRSIVANAGVTLYTIGAKKIIPGIRTYVSVDGGMADNPRPITYGAVYEAVIANRMSEISNETITISGKFCESGDVLIRDITLPSPLLGDVLCVFTTGAYNHSMASNYNKFCKPAMIVVNNGVHRLILRREIPNDLLRYDIVTPEL